jgi:hypothetical protein
MHNLNKCIEILERGFEPGKILFSCGNLYENCVEKNFAECSSNTRILNKKQKLAFFGGGKRWIIVFKKITATA